MATECKIDGCERQSKTKGLCIRHYHRLIRYGDPLKGGKFIETKAGEPFAYLMEKIKTESDDCLLWPYARSQDGPGFVSVDGKHRCVHQVVCEIVNGPRGDNQVTRHLCGNGHLGCFNPKHLAWGTQKENLEDRKTHGTLYFAGTDAAKKLDRNEVLEVYNSKDSVKVISEKYNVTRQTIHRIKNGIVHAKITGHKKKGGD